MTHISLLVLDVERGAQRFGTCPREQALVYSCEEVTARQCPPRRLSVSEAELLVSQICLAEDIDVPFVQFGNTTSRCVAWTSHRFRTVGFAGRSTTMDCLVHEIAHLLAGHDAHDARFRGCLLQLARLHAGFEYAALLCSLFERVGLSVAEFRS